MVLCYHKNNQNQSTGKTSGHRQMTAVECLCLTLMPRLALLLCCL